MKHILYWLGGFAVALGIFQYYETHRYSEDQLIYAQPPQNRSAVADFDALAYLNFLRSSANLPALTHSATLERAARNHARYLLQNPDDGHDDTIRAIPFTQAHAHQTARAKPVMPIKACTKTSAPASTRQTKKLTTTCLPNISWTT